MGMSCPLLAGYLGEVVIRTDEERLRAKQEADSYVEKDPPPGEGEIRRRRYAKRAPWVALAKFLPHYP